MASEEDLKHAYRVAFGGKEGAMVLEDILSIAPCDRSVFNPDPYQNARNQGKQEVGFHILNQLKDSNHDSSSTKSKSKRSTGSSTGSKGQPHPTASRIKA